ncbi:MAG: glycine cleavage system aminomethyltransferase GcvT [Synechococcales cyanobacterium T60_A2020_003]|nr:glycine cleavage system aminomethyltransferase GcvT [Synechococcales cyanobacterium T60_A2020_003]
MNHSRSEEPLLDTLITFQTPLYQLHREHQARLIEFGGWEMPVQYTGITQEHQAVRQAVGVFDISHMGKFELLGEDLVKILQRFVPSDLSKLHAGDALYTVLLNDTAGIIDDLIIYHHGMAEGNRERISLIVNAATTEKDKTWLAAHLDLGRIEFRDHSRDYVLVAIQGPQAVATLQAYVPIDLQSVKRYKHAESTIMGAPAFLARTGYTGEDGFEVMLPNGVGQDFWRSLLDSGVEPCGLGARDTLRLEAAMALYGQDIDETTTPLEAGLGWLVHLDRTGDFIGRAVLEQQKQNSVQRRLVGLKMEGRAIARHGYPIMIDGEPVGVVTSGSVSPTLGYPIALAYVPTAYAKPGQEVEVAIRGKTYPATVVKRPFYKSPHW